MKYFIQDTEIEFKVGDYVEVACYDITYFGIITEVEEIMWDIRGQLNVYVNHEGVYSKHSDIVALYRKNKRGNLICLYEDKERKKMIEEYRNAGVIEI